MKKDYIVYKQFYYASEFIKKIENTPCRVVCDNHWNEEKGT